MTSCLFDFFYRFIGRLAFIGLTSVFPYVRIYSNLFIYKGLKGFMQKENKQLIPLIRGAIGTLVEHPIILFPFLTIAFFQLLTVEILYFSIRPPLSSFFAPIITWKFGGQFLHYPLNYIAVLKLFHYAQYVIYLFVGGAMISMSMALIADINSGKKPRLSLSFKAVLSQYVHIFLSALLFFVVFFFLKRLYDLTFMRALAIRSEAGIFYLLKVVVIKGAPYFALLMGVFVTVLFAFVLPLIIIEKKKIFSALFLNVKYLWRSCWFIFWVVFLPTILYVPFLLLKNSIIQTFSAAFPSTRLFVLILSIFLMMIIDALVYTAIATYYLINKESS